MLKDFIFYAVAANIIALIAALAGASVDTENFTPYFSLNSHLIELTDNWGCQYLMLNKANNRNRTVWEKDH